MQKNLFFGIDYGSKLAGTTTICYQNQKNKTIEILQTQKNEDADKFIAQKAAELHPQIIFIDAPLSLPIAYQNPNAEDPKPNFFYRQCDTETQAMSPLFLGGLTARAMQLKHQLQRQNIKIYETYPAFLVKKIINDPTVAYKTKTASVHDFINHLKKTTFNELLTDIQCPVMDNWHQVDGFLAWISAYRFSLNQHICLGNEQEGNIFI